MRRICPQGVFETCVSLLSPQKKGTGAQYHWVCKDKWQRNRLCVDFSTEVRPAWKFDQEAILDYSRKEDLRNSLKFIKWGSCACIHYMSMTFIKKGMPSFILCILPSVVLLNVIYNVHTMHTALYTCSTVSVHCTMYIECSIKFKYSNAFYLQAPPVHTILNVICILCIVPSALVVRYQCVAPCMLTAA